MLHGVHIMLCSTMLYILYYVTYVTLCFICFITNVTLLQHVEIMSRVYREAWRLRVQSTSLNVNA